MGEARGGRARGGGAGGGAWGWGVCASPSIAPTSTVGKAGCSRGTSPRLCHPTRRAVAARGRTPPTGPRGPGHAPPPPPPPLSQPQRLAPGLLDRHAANSDHDQGTQRQERRMGLDAGPVAKSRSSTQSRQITSPWGPGFSSCKRGHVVTVRIKSRGEFHEDNKRAYLPLCTLVQPTGV